MISSSLSAACLVSMKRLLESCRRHVAEVPVEALRIVPVHPPEVRQFQTLNRPPGTGSGRFAEEFGLVLDLDRLGQGVVTRIPDSHERDNRADIREAFTVANGSELRS